MEKTKSQLELMYGPVLCTRVYTHVVTTRLKSAHLGSRSFFRLRRVRHRDLNFINSSRAVLYTCQTKLENIFILSSDLSNGSKQRASRVITYYNILLIITLTRILSFIVFDKAINIL